MIYHNKIIKGKVVTMMYDPATEMWTLHRVTPEKGRIHRFLAIINNMLYKIRKL